LLMVVVQEWAQARFTIDENKGLPFPRRAYKYSKGTWSD
jgi:hypothetical protein